MQGFLASCFQVNAVWETEKNVTFLMTFSGLIYEWIKLLITVAPKVTIYLFPEKDI